MNKFSQRCHGIVSEVIVNKQPHPVTCHILFIIAPNLIEYCAQILITDDVLVTVLKRVISLMCRTL